MKLLVFQHDDCVHVGQLRHSLVADAVDVTTVKLDAGDAIPDLDPFDALWVLGGTMNVWDTEKHPWLIDEKRAIAAWVRDLRRPYLGLCLGHQLLADALGGTCGPMVPPEIGVLDIELTAAGIDDPIFAGMAQRQPALQWHSAQVAQPPEGAVILASSPVCAVQAMRVGDVAWSTQYHFEVEATTVRSWGELPATKAALQATLGPHAMPDLISDADAQLSTFAANSALLYANFVAAVARHGETRTQRNELGQPIGVPVGAATAQPPSASPMSGQFCEVTRLDPVVHGPSLFQAYSAASDDGDWTYLSYGPFDEPAEFDTWLTGMAAQDDPMFFAIVDRATGSAVGLASYLRINPASRSIEVGHIHFSRALQQKPAATEAMFLMMQRAFDSGYRRYEWKCDSLNSPSQAAARRLGFSPDGVFPKATHYKGRSRDTAWFSIVDDAWPALEAEFEQWLDPSNFEPDGTQRRSLAVPRS